MKPRLTTPLVKRSGRLVSASWDDALDTAVRGLTEVQRTHGGAALGVFSCSKATNETNYLAQKYARLVLGTNNVDSCNRT